LRSVAWLIIDEIATTDDACRPRSHQRESATTPPRRHRRNDTAATIDDP
jgi:hypothetical protein